MNAALQLAVLCVVVAATQAFVMPDPEVTVFKSGGFCISIKHEEGIEQFAVHYRVNGARITGTAAQPDVENHDVNQRTGNEWKYCTKAPLLSEVNKDKINFWVWCKYNGLGYQKLDLVYVVKDSQRV